MYAKHTCKTQCEKQILDKSKSSEIHYCFIVLKFQSEFTAVKIIGCFINACKNLCIYFLSNSVKSLVWNMQFFQKVCKWINSLKVDEIY